MMRPKAGVVALVAAPFLVGCMGVRSIAIPEPAARSGQEVRGVVLSGVGGSDGERLEARRVEDVRWTDSTLAITGVFASSGDGIETREFSLDSLSAILVRGLDVNRTSAIIAVAVVGTVAAIALIINGKGDQGPLR